MKRAIKAVPEGVVEKIACVDFDAGGVVKTKGVNKVTTLAGSWRKQGHQRMKGKCIGKDGLIASMKVAAGNSGSVEREAHVRKARADELRVDARVMRHGRANSVFVVIKLLREGMLNFKALDRCSKLPKRRRVFQMLTEGRDRFANVTRNGIRQ